MLAYFTADHILRMSIELSLGICLKLFCDNGRLHWRDFVNDFVLGLPGAKRLFGTSQLPADGLTRAVAAIELPERPEEYVATEHALAAK